MDATRRNPLINNSLTNRSASFIRIVDEKPNSIYEILKAGRPMNIVSLPALDDELPDEQTPEFLNALQVVSETDEQYLADLDALDLDNDELAYEKQVVAERQLKDRLRELLELAPRLTQEDANKLADHARNHGINPSFTLPEPSATADDDRFVDDDLQTLVLPRTFNARLGRIYSRAKTMAEEKGINAVYLTLGYLIWKDPSSSSNQDNFKSPLLILPVSINRERTPDGERYSVQLRDEAELMLNPVLQHKLSNEHGLSLELPEGGLETNTVEEIYAKIMEQAPRNLSWRIARQAVVGIYPFQGIELYNDLDPSDIDFSEFDVISQVFSGVGSSGSPPSYNEYSIDDVETTCGERLVPRLVLDADSSQLLALMKAADGQNMAIEGPPGSGKSQTIVNLIANAVGSGKRVLFVAQKGTALQVVLSRLKHLGLSDLVLPLMGKKADSQEFYEALKKRVDLHNTPIPTHTDSTRVDLQRRRSDLNGYVSVLGSSVPGTELTVHQVMGLAAKYGSDISVLPSGLRRCSPDLSGLSFTINSQLPSHLEALGNAWAEQLAEVQLQDGTIWATLQEGGRDYRALESLNKDMQELTENITSLESNYSQVDIGEHWLVCSEKENMRRLSETMRTCGEAMVKWETLAKNASKSKELTSELLNILNMKDAALRILGLSWELLTSFINHEKALDLVVESMDALQLKSCSLADLEARLEAAREGRSSLEQILAVRDFAEEITGLDDITPQELKCIAPPMLYNPLLADRKLIKHVSKAGLEDAQSLLAGASDLCMRLVKLDISTVKLPTHSRLKELVHIITSSGALSLFSKSYRTAKTDVMTLLALKQYSKPIALAKLEELAELYSAWQQNPIALSLGGFEEATIYERLSQHIEAVSSLTTELKRQRVSPERFAILADPDILDRVSEQAKSFTLVERDTHWNDIRSSLDVSGQEIEAIERLITDQSEFLRSLEECDFTSTENLRRLTRNLPVIKEAQQYFTLKEQSLHELMGKLYKGQETTTRHLEQFVTILDYFDSLGEATRDGVITEFLAGRVDLAELIIFHEKLVELHESRAEIDSIARQLGATSSLPDSLGDMRNLLERSLEDTLAKEKLIQRAVIYKDVAHHGLLDVIKTCEREGTIENLGGHLTPVIVKTLADELYLQHGEYITEFSGKRLDTLRSELKRLDQRLLGFAPEEVRSAAIGSATPPSGVGHGRKSAYTDMALIDHELNKQRRISPTKLISRARNALLELHPCWMMVPTAVASYLPRTELFDLVVIDEASQMTPEHSISALMRARQAIVVGDTNQLPPSNLFRGSTALDGDEDEDLATVEESILELANMQFHPKHRLQWHYRSRHESLIAFSNHYIYDDDLVIFPSPGGPPGAMGVELRRVDGVYGRGLNPTEAAVMVEGIIAFMERDADRSLGVVVMNQSQMEQINTLVIQESDRNPAVANYLDDWQARDDGLQSFFVKNLENVQGDERDVIFIGTVYGSDSLGKFAHNFGPINGVAGKRRLNVLFSRAKEKIVTYTSIPMDKLNPGEHNEGGILLKRWLEYSAKGSLGEVVRRDGRSEFGPDSPFEEHVIEQIEAMGFEAIPQVGVSNYYIDIGVRHKTYPYGYLCGVECDGASYHSTRSARERDILRQGVLERLGWNIYRIWSTDWFRDGLTQRDLLKNHLHERLEHQMAQAPSMFDVADEDHRSVDEYTNQDDEPHLTMDDELDTLIDDIVVDIGTKMVVRYLDGPRAGMKSKYFLCDSQNQSIDDETFQALAYKSPLGLAVKRETEGSIVSFEQPHGAVRVKIEELVD